MPEPNQYENMWDMIDDALIKPVKPNVSITDFMSTAWAKWCADWRWNSFWSIFAAIGLREALRRPPRAIRVSIEGGRVLWTRSLWRTCPAYRVCYCGTVVDYHTVGDGHVPVPMCNWPDCECIDLWPGEPA